MINESNQPDSVAGGGQPEPLFETVVCAICGSSEESTIFTGPDRLTGLPGNFRLVRCDNCGAFRQNPRLVWTSLRQYYPDEEYIAYDLLASESYPRWQQWVLNRGVAKRLRYIEAVRPGGRLLDIGCGTGAFLAAAKRRGGWDVEGLEPNEFAASHVRRRLGIPVTAATFPDVEYPDEEFDVVTMWNVFEHLQEPQDSLHRVHRMLKPGGFLVFTLPNVESLDAQLAKEHWIGWDLPRHLHLYPQTTIEHLLTANGFQLIDTRCLFGTYHALGLSLMLWASDDRLRPRALARILMRLYYTLLARAALLLPLWIMDRMKRSTLITVLAKRIDN